MKKFIFIICIILLTGCSPLNKSNYDNEEEFLLSGFISDSSVVGSGYPSGYYFNGNGNFSYYVGEMVDVELNGLVTYRGTWKIEDNKLILTVLEEERTTRAYDIWDDLDKKEVNYKIVFKNLKLKGDHLSTNKGDLYSLSVDDSYLKMLRALSNSYDKYYEAKNEYYFTI